MGRSVNDILLEDDYLAAIGGSCKKLEKFL